MNPPRGRRWPPAPRHPAPAGENAGHAGLDTAGMDWPAAIGDLSDLLRMMLPGSVLGEDTYQLDRFGQAGDQYKIPFAALAISSTSASQLSLCADTLKIGPPPSGPGVAVIPPRGFAVVNMKGYAWSVYGGTPGDQITIQAFTRPQVPIFEAGPLTGAALGTVAVSGSLGSSSDYPAGAIPITGDSGNQANTAAVATLAGVAGKTTWITGFEVTGTGATGVLVVTVAVAGPAASLHYTYVFVAGVTTPNTPLIVEFPKPVPAAAVNTPITVTVPASGLGGTNSTAVAHGYQL